MRDATNRSIFADGENSSSRATVDAAKTPAAREGAQAGAAEGGGAGVSSTPIHPVPPFPSHGLFEGSITITMTTTGRRGSSVFVLWVKGAKTRIDFPESGSYVIRARAEHWGTTVSPAKKTVTRGLFADVPFDVLVQLTLTADASTVATGQTDVIAGVPCHVYRVREPHGDEHECCLVLTPFAADGAEADAPKPQTSDLFSLRTVVKDTSRQRGVRLEVTKIEEKPVDPSLFVVPAGYRRVTVGFQR